MHTPSHAPPPHSRPSTPSEDWVFVDGAHTETRSPQFKDENSCSGQLATASADGSLFSLILSKAASADIIDNTNTNTNTNDNDPTVAHKPPSNISTETPGTDDTTATVTDLRRAAAAPTRCTPGDLVAHQALTLSNMAAHQRALEQRHTDSLACWAANAGMGSRRRPAGKMPPSSSLSSSSAGYCSVLTVGGLSMGSRSSVGGGVGEWACVQPPMRGDEEVSGAGAWCREITVTL